MNKIAIYTAIFGENQVLYPQPPIQGFDFICFSDKAHQTPGWKVILVEKPYENDSVRSNRYYKILPHLFLKEYEYSIYMDGNFIILKSPLPLIVSEMQDSNMLVFDHNQTAKDLRNCVYKEGNAIVDLYQKKGVLKDDLALIETQLNVYKSKGYPQNRGLIKGGVLIRKHNEPDVVQTMERWWYFVERYSKRDQLSFNYAAWETNLNFKFLPGDIRRGNPWFYMVSKADQNLSFSLLKYKWRNSIGGFFDSAIKLLKRTFRFS